MFLMLVMLDFFGMQPENLPILLSLFLSLYVLVLFFLTLFDEEETGMIKIEDLPKIAVIIPAFNEAENIVKTVQSVLNLQYPQDKLYIVVVDDGSIDDTYKTTREHFAGLKNLHILRKVNEGKAEAVNHALNKLPKDIEYVGVLDADSFVKEDALLKVVQRFLSDQNIQAVTSAIKIYNPNGIAQFLQNAEYALSIWLRRALDRLGLIFIIPGPFSFYKVSALKKAGEFKHAHGTEDLEMGLRFQKLGLKIANAPESVVYTVSPDTVYKLYKQRLRWTYGFLNNAIDYKHLFFRKDALGLFMLPVSVLAIVFVLISVFQLFYRLANYVAEKAISIYYFGFNFGFDLFYIHVNILLWLAVVVMGASVLSLKLGDGMTGAPSVKFKDVASYMLLYGFIAPVWLLAATFKTITRSQVKWVKVNK